MNLRPPWWNERYEEALRRHLEAGGGLGWKALQSGLGVNSNRAVALSVILSPPAALTPERLEKARRLFKAGKGRQGIAQALGVSHPTAQRIIHYLSAQPWLPSAPKADVVDTPDGKAVVVYLRDSQTMPSPQELLEQLGIDPALWEIVKATVDRGTWDMGRKAVRAKLSYRDNKKSGELIDEGRIQAETLHRWRVEIQLRPRQELITFREAMRAMVEEAKLHADTPEGTTTKGTRLDVDTRWQRMFRAARSLMVEIVDRLRHVAPVKLVVIPGNHDGSTAFYLGEALEGWYARTADVEIDNAPTVRKFHRWGNVLLWFYHGHEGKPADWFADMANNAGPAWYECRVREGILGHIHQERTLEYKGVLFRNLRSLSATDAWHYEHFFCNNIRGLQGLLYHEQVGPYAPIPYYVFDEKEE